MPFPEPDPRAVPVRWAALLVHPIAKGPERFVAAIAAVGPDGEASCRVMAGADRMVELFGEDADHVAGVDTAVESLSRHLGDGGGMADWTSPLESARLGDIATTYAPGFDIAFAMAAATCVSFGRPARAGAVPALADGTRRPKIEFGPVREGNGGAYRRIGVTVNGEPCGELLRYPESRRRWVPSGMLRAFLGGDRDGQPRPGRGAALGEAKRFVKDAVADMAAAGREMPRGDVVCRRTADGGTVATGVAGWPDTGPVDWGAAGTSAGSAALAINVLYAFSGDEGFAERRSGDFARDVVARVPPAGGTIRADDVRAWVADARRREQGHREIPDRRAGRSRR